MGIGFEIRRRSNCGAGVCAIAVVLAGPAFGQEARVTKAEAAQASGISEIIVTARRRDERLQDVPVAISAFTTQDIKRYDTSSITQIVSQTPQLMAGLSPNSLAGGSMFMRGIGSPSTSAQIDQAVSIAIDGIQISKAFVMKLGVYDLAHVEVLKGPQALFFGKNSPGGVISITSADPTDDFSGSARVGYEVYAQRKYTEANVSIPLTDALKMRVDGYFSDENGWFINTAQPMRSLPVPASFGGGATTPGVGTTHSRFPGVTNAFGRGTLKYNAHAGFDATLKVAYMHTRTNGGLAGLNQLLDCPAGVPYFATVLGVQNFPAGALDCKLDRYNNVPDLSPAIAAINPDLFPADGKQFMEDNQLLASLNMNLKIADNLTLTSVTGYWNFSNKSLANFSYTNYAYGNSGTHINDKQFTQELRLSSSFSAPFNFTAGAFYQYEKSGTKTEFIIDSPLSNAFLGVPGPVAVLANTVEQKTNAWSVFAQGIVDVSSKLQLTAGGRYSREKKDAYAQGDPSAFYTRPTPAVITPNSMTWRNFSPETTLTYKPVQNLSIFASYRRGFKSGGFDLNTSIPAFGAVNVGDISYGQEKIKGFEAGMKSNLFDRQLVLDLTGYTYKYSGIQVSRFDPITISYKVTNAASAHIKGIDFSAQFRPKAISNLTLRTAVAYNSAKYGSFPDSPCYAGQSQADGCAYVPVTDASGALVGVRRAAAGETAIMQDLSGHTMYHAPEWSYNFGASYDQPLFNGMKLGFAVDGLYTGSQQGAPEQDPRALVKSVWKLNATITLTGVDDRWQLSLIGTNLTNQLRAYDILGLAGTAAGTGTNNAILGDLQGGVTEPRALALQAKYNF